MKLTDNQYDVLTFIANKLPLLATFYCAIAKLWNLPLAVEVSGTIMAAAAMLQGFLDHTSKEYYKSVAAAQEFFEEPEEKVM